MWHRESRGNAAREAGVIQAKQPKTFARAVAEAVKGLDVKVSTSQDVGGGFPVENMEYFVHKDCRSTHSEASWDDIWTLRESVAEVCGDDAVALRYDYDYPRFASTSPGQIRLLMPDKRRYTKFYESNGTFAFRFDSVLSHLSIMRGNFPEAPYGLKPGQLLPAQHTDESVKGGLYFYGSLFACRTSGQGKLTFEDLAGDIDPQVQAFCGLGIISILRVTDVLAGPTGKNDAQWAKSGNNPKCAYVVGSIVSKQQHNAFHHMISLNNWRSCVNDMLQVVADPSKYLPFESFAFLERYVAGGSFLAHAEWLPLRCIHKLPLKKHKSASVNWIAGKLIESRVVAFIRDDSCAHPKNQAVIKVLMDWVKRGLNEEKVVYDPKTHTCYTLMEAAQLEKRSYEEFEMAQCALGRAYKSAIESAMVCGTNKQQHKKAAIPSGKRPYVETNLSKKRSCIDERLIETKPSTASGSEPNRSREQEFTDDADVQERLGPRTTSGSSLEQQHKQAALPPGKRPYAETKLSNKRPCIDERLIETRGPQSPRGPVGLVIDARMAGSSPSARGCSGREAVVTTDASASSGDLETTDEATSMLHHLARSTAFAIYDFLEGKETQMTKSLFAKKRRGTMMKCLKNILEKNPECAWKDTVFAVTAHLISQDRAKWKLWIKQIGEHEIHPICKSNQEGARASWLLLAHMLIKAPSIVEEARSEVKKENAKKERGCLKRQTKGKVKRRAK